MFGRFISKPIFPMANIELEKELVSVKVQRGTQQKVRVLASLEGMTSQEWYANMVDKAYEASVHLRGGRKVSVKSRK